MSMDETSKNLIKYYWKNLKSNGEIDYNMGFIGSMSSSRFVWNDKVHLLTMNKFFMDEEYRSKKLISRGNEELTPLEFIKEVLSGTKMWLFERVP